MFYQSGFTEEYDLRGKCFKRLNLKCNCNKTIVTVFKKGGQQKDGRGMDKLNYLGGILKGGI